MEGESQEQSGTRVWSVFLGSSLPTLMQPGMTLNSRVSLAGPSMHYRQAWNLQSLWLWSIRLGNWKRHCLDFQIAVANLVPMVVRVWCISHIHACKSRLFLSPCSPPVSLHCTPLKLQPMHSLSLSFSHSVSFPSSISIGDFAEGAPICHQPVCRAPWNKTQN